jgi:hypothetical protein
MGQIIHINQWRYRHVQPAGPASADDGLPSWQAFPLTLVDPFFLASLALWRACIAANAGWWLAPLGVVIRPIETSRFIRPSERLSSKS